MPQVAVTIAGRVYRMACGEGEEARLEALGRRLDARIDELRGDFGEIGDQRITVMAALTMADDLAEAERRIASLEAEVTALSQDRRSADQQIEALGDAVAVALDDAARRIDHVAQSMLRGVRG